MKACDELELISHMWKKTDVLLRLATKQQNLKTIIVYENLISEDVKNLFWLQSFCR